LTNIKDYIRDFASVNSLFSFVAEKGKGKGKSHPITCHEGQAGE
jgi:hypothetical protein